MINRDRVKGVVATFHCDERGQTIILMALVMLLLVGFIGFAVDYTNLWHQRQLVQTASDAACQAAAMDEYYTIVGTPTTNMNYTPPPKGGVIDCASPISSSSPAPCVIANYNDAAIAVKMTFSTTAPAGVTPPASAPQCATASPSTCAPYITVDTTKDIKTFFPQVLSHVSTVPVHASAVCALTAPDVAPPIIVLHPTLSPSFDIQGNPNVQIVGGPTRSIQVNSDSATAVNVGGSATADLSIAGPSGDGGDFAVLGGPTATPGGVLLGTRPGHWLTLIPPIADPYANISAPSRPPQPANGNCPGHRLGCTVVAYKAQGCPDSGGCEEYVPGWYPSGITVKNKTALFDPGLYYVDGGLTLDANSNVRTSYAPTGCAINSVGCGDGSGGIMFYFHGAGTNNCGSTKGTNLCSTGNSGSGTTDAYYINGGPSPNGVYSRALQCPGGGSNPSVVPATINGNVLLGPCTGPYRDPSGLYRGFVFWQDRGAAAAGALQGGGAILVSGFQYFHLCNSNGSGTQPCTIPLGTTVGTYSSYNLQGNSPSGSFTIGSVITDVLGLGGTAHIYMYLSPSPSFTGLKIAMVQ